MGGESNNRSLMQYYGVEGIFIGKGHFEGLSERSSIYSFTTVELSTLVFK